MRKNIFRKAVIAFIAGVLIPFTAKGQCLEWVEKSPTTRPSARGSSAMAYHAANGLVLFGGDDSPGSVGLAGDTWAYRNGDWMQLHPASSPSARTQHAMVYAPACGGILLFGGNDDSADVNDLWRWDGSNWSQIQQTGSWPSARRAHAMAYDRSRGIVVLYGGVSGGGPFTYYSDTWEYDCGSGAWTEKVVSGTTARAGHSMEWHPANGILLVGDAGIPGDTWSWNGTAWTELTSPSCPITTGRSWTPIAYDDRRNRIVMFGGNPGNVGTGLNDTWEWDGSCWSQIHPNNTGGLPTVRSRHAAAFDPTTGKTVVFGGYPNKTDLLDDTWEYPNVANRDCNGNGIPDECDATPSNDVDGDGVLDICDNCPTIPNANQSNIDGDAFGDVCDPCPFDPTNTKVDGRCIPTLSEWGMMAMAALMLSAGGVVIARRKAA